VSPSVLRDVSKNGLRLLAATVAGAEVGIVIFNYQILRGLLLMELTSEQRDYKIM
jgi:hypothetical protein